MDRLTEKLYKMQIQEIEKLGERVEEKEADINLEDFASVFEKLTDSLNELIIPLSLFSVNESAYICEGEERKDFEKNLRKFKTHYKQTLMFCKAFIDCKKPITTKDSKKKTFIYKFDANIKVTVDNFNDIVSTEDSEKFDDVKCVKDKYFAYLVLTIAINTVFVQYNKKFPDYKLETLENIPEPKFLDSIEDFKKFFIKYGYGIIPLRTFNIEKRAN